MEKEVIGTHSCRHSHLYTERGKIFEENICNLSRKGYCLEYMKISENSTVKKWTLATDGQWIGILSKMIIDKDTKNNQHC